MGTRNREDKKEKRAMIFKVCLRSGLGAALLGLIIGIFLLKIPALHIVLFPTVIAGIGGGIYRSFFLYPKFKGIRRPFANYGCFCPSCI